MRDRTSTWWALIAAVGLTLAFAGCGRSPEQGKDTELIHAYRLIDAQQDDEAISYLNDLCQRKPSNQCSITLASAYAHKAGIKIQKFVGLVAATKNMHSMNLNFHISSDPNVPSLAIDSTLQNIAGLLSRFQTVFNLYQAIPDVKSSDNVYVEEAIKILTGVDQPRESDALYRAILRIIEFKYNFAQQIIGMGSEEALGPDCILDLSQMSDTVAKLSHDLIDVFDDLSLASPSKASSYGHAKTTITKETQALTSGLNSITVTDEAATIYFKRMLIEHGFGALLKCKGGRSS